MTRYIRKRNPPPRPPIVYDDREKQPWMFLEDTWAMEKKRLKVGDYSFEGYEEAVAIEKKSGMGEMLKDLTGDYRKTFKRFLKRLSAYPVKCIVVENELRASSVESIIRGLHYRSNGRSQLTEETVFYWVGEIMMVYGVPVLFVERAMRKKVIPFLFESAYKAAMEVKL